MQSDQPVLTEDQMLDLMELAGYKMEMTFVQDIQEYQIRISNGKKSFGVKMSAEDYEIHAIPTVFNAYVRMQDAS